jgi:hypothetical protein
MESCARASRATVEQLERRAMLSAAALIAAFDMSEGEPNDTAASANSVPVSATPTIVTGSIATGTDVDYFKFTISARSGVFFDVDSREIGLSATLDSVLDVYDGTGATSFGNNDDGRDFDTIALNETTETPNLFGDSSLYLDLNAGTYVVKLSGAGTIGSYHLKLTADSGYASAMPVFSSLAGAADTLHLDFDGHTATDGWNGGNTYTIPAFDLNANAAEFTPGERLAIYDTWRVVADAFAPFNINVTTSYAGAYADGTAWRQVIGNSDGSQVGQAGSLGVAWINGYNSGGPAYKTGFTFANNFIDYPTAGVSGRIVANAIEIGNSSVHEIGHAMGLDHYGDTGHKGAFMYVPDFGVNRERWSSGTNSAAIFQDDLATIASPLNTFGYRADDHGNTRPAATILTASGNAYAASGVIHQISDIDDFRFTGSGATTVTLDIPEHLGHLDGELYLYTAAGTLIGSSDVNTRLGESISMTLPAAGDYYVEVRSDGGYSDLGMYDLRISTIVPAGAISGRVFRDVTLNNSYQPAGGDTILGGVTVFIDGDNDGVLDIGERSTASNAIDGTYSFTGLANGAYNVKQITPSGYLSNISYNRTIATGESYPNLDFGNFPIVYAGSGGNDNYIVRLNAGSPGTLEIVESFSGLTYSAPRALVPSLTINGGNGNDTATLATAIPLLFNGGTDPATTDTLNVSAGTYNFNADAAAGTAHLIVNLNNAVGIVRFNTTQHLKGLNISAGVASMETGGGLMLVTDTLTITGGQLDLRDNDLIVHSGAIGTSTSSGYNGITGLIASGYDFGAWDGSGVITSMPAAAAGTTTLGIATGAALFGLGPTQAGAWSGESITGNSVLVKYTYAGDANLDGVIDGGDYGVIDNFVQVSGAYGYFNGDFNYDGVIDGGDYGIIDNNVQAQGTPL